MRGECGRIQPNGRLASFAAAVGDREQDRGADRLRTADLERFESPWFDDAPPTAAACFALTRNPAATWTCRLRPAGPAW